MKLRKLVTAAFSIVLIGALFLVPLKAFAADGDAGEQNCSGASCNVGGQNITPDDIRAAITSPTPNLANTTAYVFYTITVLLTSTFNVNGANSGTQPGATETPTPAAPASGASAPSETNIASSSYPTSIHDAVNQAGLIGGAGFMLAELVKHKPASDQLYVADLVQHSRFVPQTAYAQSPGLGFGALDPILETWKAFRNVSYYLLTIIFMVVGFLILIRHKVSGNIAVTVQAALPRLVITLVLITFSYAIAGLLVDALFLAMYFIINVFTGSGIFTGAALQPSTIIGGPESTPVNIAFNTHIFTFTLQYIFSGSGWNVATSISETIFSAFRGLGGVIGGIADQPVIGDVLKWIVSQIFAIIIAVAIFIAMFRTFFSLLMSYVGFVINVVMAPFILLPGAIPGQNPFSNWLKNLIAGLAPFAVTLFMIFMAFALIGGDGVKPGVGYKDATTNNATGTTRGLRLPFILGGTANDAIPGILSLGFILLLPEAVQMTKKAIGANGGIFDEFKDKAVANLQKGWSGNQYVPGARKIAPSVGGAAALTAVGAGAGLIGGGIRGYRQPVRDQDLPNGLITGRLPTGVRRGIARVDNTVGGGVRGAALVGAGAAILPAVSGVNKSAGNFVNTKITPRVEGLNSALREAQIFANRTGGGNSAIDSAVATQAPQQPNGQAPILPPNNPTETPPSA